ncbi:hypothetical protein [Nocardia sp. BMG51109]|uniref:hypothetical protein n=1 Tax=Nocardia sp. BMG51109 TaxID=1056816 RepID=UPI0004B94962|nr:hypothetical protein [Nocardia sp. BMG51109]
MNRMSKQHSVVGSASSRRYYPPVVVASFARSELANQLPEIITPHIHTSQSS